MAVNFGEPDDGADDEGSQSGGKLREKFEQALATNKELTDKLTTYEAKDFLADKAFALVKPEDLQGVTPDKFEEHATKVQQDRQALAEEVLRASLTAKGYDGDELDDLLAQMVRIETPNQEQAEATRRIRAAGSVEGLPVPRVDPSKLHGFDAIAAGIEQNARKRTRS